MAEFFVSLQPEASVCCKRRPAGGYTLPSDKKPESLKRTTFGDDLWEDLANKLNPLMKQINRGNRISEVVFVVTLITIGVLGGLASADVLFPGIGLPDMIFLGFVGAFGLYLGFQVYQVYWNNSWIDQDITDLVKSDEVRSRFAAQGYEIHYEFSQKSKKVVEYEMGAPQRALVFTRVSSSS